MKHKRVPFLEPCHIYIYTHTSLFRLCLCMTNNWFLWKSLITIAAMILFILCMCPHMDYKSVITWESLITMIILKYFSPLVWCNMSQCPNQYDYFNYVLLKHFYLRWKSCHNCYTDMVLPHCVSLDDLSYYYSLVKPYHINCTDEASLLCEFVNVCQYYLPPLLFCYSCCTDMVYLQCVTSYG